MIHKVENSTHERIETTFDFVNDILITLMNEKRAIWHTSKESTLTVVLDTCTIIKCLIRNSLSTQSTLTDKV